MAADVCSGNVATCRDYRLSQVGCRRLKCNPDVDCSFVQGPRCSIRSKNMYSDLTVDYLKMTLLNLPATLLVRNLCNPPSSRLALNLTCLLGAALFWAARAELSWL